MQESGVNKLAGPNGADFAQQQALRARMVRPGSGFVPLKLSEVAEQSVTQRFEQQVRLYPNHTAIKAGEQVFTYQALNKAANRLAQAILARQGSGPEPVALLLGHDPSALVALLAVLKAGKFFVALDPTFPEARNAAIREHAQANLIVTSSHLQSSAAPLVPTRRQLLEVDRLGSDATTDADPGLPLTADALAGIIYTSGSTGQPKGVVFTHRTLLHRAVAQTNGLCVGSEDRLGWHFSLSAVATTTNIFSALLTGASLSAYDVRANGVSDFASWLIEEGITVLNVTPSLFRRWVATLSGREKFPQLRVMRLRSEATVPEDVQLFKEHFTPGCILNVTLGSTEFGNTVNYYIDQDTEVPGPRVPVGYPIEGTEVLLVDDDGLDVGFNQTGEIAIRSRYLSPGYWHDLGLTQARFHPDPQGGDARVYSTGDLGLRLPGGCLFHLGRKDSQVKIRGFRVEMAEVELALSSIDGVKEAAVVAREDDPGDPRLVAYLVPKDKPGPSVSALRHVLAEKLPAYMVPSAFVTLEALPLLPSGKVDRLALPVPGKERPSVEQSFAAPETPMEEMLAEIWADVLGIERVGIHDNFFDLGGNSLLAMRVLARLKKARGLRINFRELTYETLGQLAANCDDKLHDPRPAKLRVSAWRILSKFKSAVGSKRTPIR